MDTIRIIHNLPRSGGTIFAKSVSAQRDIILLSEIHPIGPKIREKMGVETDWGDPLYQLYNWYHLLDIKEYNEIKNSNLNFLSKIKFINNKIKNQKKTLIIRDWSFIDFFGRPYVKPNQKLSLYEILSSDFKIKNIFLIRDPIEMFISCNQKLVFFRDNYTFDIFLDGYGSFLKNIKYDEFIIFEKFVQNPSLNLKKVSKILNFKCSVIRALCFAKASGFKEAVLVGLDPSSSGYWWYDYASPLYDLSCPYVRYAREMHVNLRSLYSSHRRSHPGNYKSFGFPESISIVSRILSDSSFSVSMIGSDIVMRDYALSYGIPYEFRSPS